MSSRSNLSWRAIEIDGTESRQACLTTAIETCNSGVAIRADLRVVVLSRLRSYRESLVAVLQTSIGVGDCVALDLDPHAVEGVSRLAPDLVMVDVSGRNCYDVLVAIRERNAAIRILAIAVPNEADSLAECAHAGVERALVASSSVRELIASVAAIANQRSDERSVTNVGGHSSATLMPLNGRYELGLTQREKEIAALLGQSLANKEIARRLGVELSTVKSHVHSILRKLNVRRRADAVARLWA